MEMSCCADHNIVAAESLKTRFRPILIGFLGALALTSIYILLLSWANSFSEALYAYHDLWYWILPLTIGFGTQVGLFSYIRKAMKSRHDKKVATSSVTASGGMSTASMIACCAHRAVDILPILGLSAAAIFLVEYQSLFMLMGILSNIIGIFVMLNIIQKHHLFSSGGMLNKVFRINMGKALRWVIVCSVLIFGVILLAKISGPFAIL